MRQIVLDTETTGLEPDLGHRIIEIGCIEIVNRRPTGRTFHHYLNPERDIDKGALEVHGITLEALQGKPRFCDVADELMTFISGAELVIHNAAFDTAFLDSELRRHATNVAAFVGRLVSAECRILDTLALARQMHPGQRNNLDALCKRYEIDNSHRELHGALLDARILADVYLAMTGGQVGLALGELDSSSQNAGGAGQVRALVRPAVPLVVIMASADELSLHDSMLTTIAKASKGRCLWRSLETPAAPLAQSLSSA
ncbi:MAG TPA: DNA polymerase III subunit epsilon [Steroidobacteraceae bacterium]|nr:DNA polymerase III subunit epsilon [Steroidobacteraceae bacterium]